MAIPDLVLETDKRVSNVNADRIILRQSERGLVLTATILKPDGSKYDLSGKKVQFGETKDGEKAVIDEAVEIDSSQQGVIHYTMNKAVYAASGEAWFEIANNNGDVIDTTQNFVIEVEKQASINVSNDNYISSLEALNTHLKASIDKADNSLNNTLTDLQGKCSNFLNQYQQTVNKIAQDEKDFTNTTQQKYKQIDQKLTDITNAWNSQTKNIQDTANAQIADLKSKADAQRADEASKATKALNDSIAQINSQRDQALKQANDAYAKQRSDLTNQFNTWLQGIQKSYTDDINDLKNKLNAVRADITKITGTDVPAMDQKVKDIQDKVAKAQAQFASIDFNSYAKKNDVYDKPTVDKMVQQAGKVKGAKIQPIIGTKSKEFQADVITPDSDGNLILNPDAVATNYVYALYYMMMFYNSYVQDADDDQAQQTYKDEMNTYFDADKDQNVQYMNQFVQNLFSLFATNNSVQQQIQAAENELDTGFSQLVEENKNAVFDVASNGGSLDGSADLNKVDPGFYQINGKPKNYPSNIQSGILFVFKQNSSGSQIQLLMTELGEIWMRLETINPSAFGSWTLLNPITKDEVTSLKNRITTLETELNAIKQKLGDGSVAVMKKFSSTQLQDALNYSNDRSGGVTRIGEVDDK